MLQKYIKFHSEFECDIICKQYNPVVFDILEKNSSKLSQSIRSIFKNHDFVCEDNWNVDFFQNNNKYHPKNVKSSSSKKSKKINQVWKSNPEFIPLQMAWDIQRSLSNDVISRIKFFVQMA